MKLPKCKDSEMVLMRLKRLELYGCKSFATRTVFEFGEGITAIVGPNGSGKSNIADAVRWVMGEQGFSILRARSTEDMIFAGSRNRARLGIAEVIITFDNSTGWLPLDFTEVAIGRRAYRSGENEYLLNGNRVRYRDVLDLLGGAGLVRSTYTVIGQGMVDAALALRPEARRVLFEEAAGIAPHLRKRAESLRRIEETERNLERVGDILNVLRPRANSLRHQAERAEEHRQHRKDLQERQRLWYGYQWRRRQRLLTQAEELLREGEARLEAQRAYGRSLEEKQEGIVALQGRQRQLVEKLTSDQGALQAQMETERRELAILTERMRLYRLERESLEIEVQSLASRQGILEREVERTRREVAEQEALCSTGQAELDAARARLSALDASRQDMGKQAAAEEARLAQIIAAASDARARLEGLGERRLELIAERDQVEAAQSELKERLAALRVQGERLTQHEQALEQQRLESEGNLARLQEEAAAAREQLAAAEGVVAKARAGRERLGSRRDALTQLREELTGYYPGVREVLGTKSLGLLGTVANLIQVPQELEQAIESALGPRLQNVVAERWEDAEAAISHLKRTRGGWATFLPLDTIRSRPPLALHPEPGIMGVASALVGFEERLRPVVELLLGTVVVVQDLPTARRLLERRIGATLFVTLAGDTVQPSGALSGGSRRESGGLLAQEREWRALPLRIEAAEKELAEALQTCAGHEEYLAHLFRQIQEQERQLDHLRSKREAAQAAARDHHHEVSGVERELKWQDSRKGISLRELEELTQRERRLRDDLAARQGGQKAAMEHLSELRQRLASVGDEGLRQRVAELETRDAVTRRTVQSLNALLESHRGNLSQLLDQVVEKQARYTGLSGELQQLAISTEATGARLADLERTVVSHTQELEPARQELVRLERERHDVERQRGRAGERLNELASELNRLILERDRAQGDLTALVREIEADLGPINPPEDAAHQLRLNLGDEIVELPAVASLPAGLTEEIQQLKARLRRLGDINFSAPQEYKQLVERQAFLEGQATDLHDAIAALHEVIHELDKIIERDFSSAVKAVDRSFEEIFSRLFNGGSARLVLTDPESLSTTGVDIIAHPPGKRAQSLSLLSGGERALTGVALLFALLRANPVPFCFLDEVDAALDEANVSRFRELLQEQASATQFVVITHNRHTIEAASTIYGISMSEQGVSQSVSLKLSGREGQLEAVQATEVSRG